MQWAEVAGQVNAVKKMFVADKRLGDRRTTLGEAPAADLEDAMLEAMVEREPVTVIVSRKGWIRSMRGHVADVSGLSFKAGDALMSAIHAETTDRIIVASTAGRFYTLAADKLPGGRGHGEPIRLMVDMGSADEPVAVFVHDPDRKLLVAGSDGRGFVVAEGEVVANTRKGRQVLNVSDGTELARCVSAAGDTVAVIGENRKLLLFPLDQVAEMPRGKGVRLQRYKDGGLADLRVFAASEGLSWQDSSGRTHNRSMRELKDWVGTRAQAGRLPPQGFPRSNRFGTPFV